VEIEKAVALVKKSSFDIMGEVKNNRKDQRRTNIWMKAVHSIQGKKINITILVSKY